MSFFRNLLSLLKIKRWPSRPQLRQFFRILTKREKIFFWFFFLLFLGSFIFIGFNFYFQNTGAKPGRGGVYVEGAVGQPRFINPIYANSDVDRDLLELTFSGLMKYDENLELVLDLAEKYEIEDEGKVYNFYLKENLFWQDKTPLTADDVIFTIKTIQNPDYKSPLRANWVGVEVEKINDLGIRFSIKQPYSAFVENCALKIMPEHIWKNISPENFPLEIYNLKPVGSGPYKLKEIKQDKQGKINRLTLAPNAFYHGKSPYISEIKFLFFNNEEELSKAAKSGKIKGFSSASYKNPGAGWQIYSLVLPRYFAVFFNTTEAKFLGEKEVREALNYGTNKEEIVKNVLGITENQSAQEEITNSPILPEIYGFSEPFFIYNFDLDKAKEILEKAGYKEGENGIREKEIKKEIAFQFKKELKSGSQGTEVQELQKCLSKFPEIFPEGQATSRFDEKTKEAVIAFQEKYADEILKPAGITKGTGIVGKATRDKLNKICFGPAQEKQILRFNLTTVDQPQLLQVANLLKEQWRNLGIDIEIQKFSAAPLEQDLIKPRDYEALLFGEALGAIPDLYPFWHSSQKKDPGLNLALYDNKDADKLLEEIRKSLDPEQRAEKLNLFQNILIKDAPAIFLYCPDYIYFISDEIHNLNLKKIADPSKRFSNIENWYIKTERVWK